MAVNDVLVDGLGWAEDETIGIVGAMAARERTPWSPKLVPKQPDSALRGAVREVGYPNPPTALSSSDLPNRKAIRLSQRYSP